LLFSDTIIEFSAAFSDTSKVKDERHKPSLASCSRQACVDIEPVISMSVHEMADEESGCRNMAWNMQLAE
jgi:hypothetical protein